MSFCKGTINNLTVPESAVDCNNCSSEFKCCTYRPFIANFLVGDMLTRYEVQEEWVQDWDWLLVGLCPNLKYRKQFQKKGGWGFGTEESILCSFYERSSGGCRVWESRPGVCRTFFCKSSYGEGGLEYWRQLEQYNWAGEWAVLEDFLFEKGWTLDEVAQMKEYLKEEYLSHPSKVPEEYRFSDWQAASQFYKEAQEYTSSLSKERLGELLGEVGRKQHGELLALKEKLVHI